MDARVRPAFALACLLAAACSSGGAAPPAGADLSGFRVARMAVEGVDFETYLAETPAQRAQGFMFATLDQAAPLGDGTPRGMLFVFPGDSFLSFFMRNTYIALDLAYATADGRIVEIHPLTPLDETPVVASQPVRYAFEALRGTFADHGIAVGAVMAIPP